MTDKLKHVVNTWFSNNMVNTIELKDVSDYKYFMTSSWSRRSKHNNMLKVLQASDSAVPAWLKPNINIYFVQRMVSIILKEKDHQHQKLLMYIGSAWPLYKQLGHLDKKPDVSLFKIEDPRMDYLACQSFMHRKHVNPTAEGTLGGDILYKLITDQLLTTEDIQHIEALAFQKPKEMAQFLRSTIDDVSELTPPNESQRLFINHCLDCTQDPEKAAKSFLMLKKQYPELMQEFLTWLAMSPLSKFSTEIMKKPLKAYKHDPLFPTLDFNKQIGLYAKELNAQQADHACHPQLLHLFYEHTNRYLDQSVEIHKLLKRNQLKRFSQEEYQHLKTFAAMAIISIGIGILGHTTLIAASTAFFSASTLGILGLCFSQLVILKPYHNDNRSLLKSHHSLAFNITLLGLAVIAFYIAQPYGLVLPSLLGALGGTMPLLAQLYHQHLVKRHIASTPLPETKIVGDIIENNQLGSMFKVDSSNNQVGFLQSNATEVSMEMQL